MRPRFTDIHHHILCGLDDGPATHSRMARMLDAAEQDGTRCIVATPHARPGIEPFAWDAYRSALEQANAYCRQKGYALRILGGAEVLCTQAAVRMLCDGKVPTLCGTRYVLMEWCEDEEEERISRSLRRLANAGFIPVMAHVERLHCYLRKPERLMELRAAHDIRLQANCGAVLRSPLSRSHRLVRRLCENGMLDYVASDAHDVSARPSRMTLAHQRLVQLYGRAEADALTSANQIEITGSITARNS